MKKDLASTIEAKITDKKIKNQIKIEAGKGSRRGLC